VRADEHARNAARTFNRYLAFFQQFATSDSADLVPDSAYFSAYEAGRGYGDAFLVYSPASPTLEEVDYAVDRYLQALRIFPFDRTLWPAFASALERQGRSNQYLELVRPIADRVARSRQVDAWIGSGEAGKQELAALRGAMADELAVMYLGFANEAEIASLQAGLAELRTRRAELEREILALGAGGDAPPASPAAGDAGGASGESVVARAERSRKIEAARQQLDKLDKQLAARERALPLYRGTLGTEGLIDALRAQRNHPLHTLLRRLYYEAQS
jgi:cell division protein FtsB